MRRPVAFLVFAALMSSQLVALRCDMGASTHQAAGALEAGAHESTAAHATAPHIPAPTHGTPTHGQAAPAHHPSPHPDHPAPHHGDRDACQMMMACGAASIRAVRAVAVARIPAPFVRAASFAAAIPVAADLAVETPPPRLTV
ncbi:MAG: hypothetical protein OXI76_16800 [Gemmatimonadota bacterium]|nr:hypothetical protein [Gemmatimonadota bacterium]